MRINTSLSFKSKVSRRIFVLFVVTAMVPITALAILSFTHVFKHLNEQTHRRLHQASKVVGMAVVERLSFLEGELDLIASAVKATPGISKVAITDRGSKRLGKGFRAISLVKETGVEVVFGEALLPVELNQEVKEHLRTGRAALLEKHGQREQARIYMVKAVSAVDPKQGFLWSELNTPYLWGVSDADTLPSMTEISVLDSMNNVIYTSIPLAPSFLEKLREGLAQFPAGRFEWGNTQEEYLASYWSTFLKYAFASQKWTVVLSSSTSDVLLPVAKFRKTFLLVLVVAFFTVLLLSSVQIRRSLVPLETLREGTRRIANRDFEKKVALKTGDEFEELAALFNDMGATLNAQFKALETMAEIDRAILSALDRERIVGALLHRMGDFFSFNYSSITLVDPEEEASARMYVGGQIPGEVELTQVCEITARDLKALRNNPEWFVLESNDEPPDYLAGQTLPAIRSFLILPIFLRERLAGIITFGSQANSDFSLEERVRARQMADQVAVALANAHLVQELEELNLGTLTALARAVDAKSPWTAGHSERVTEIALKIGGKLGLSEVGQERLRRGGLLHDIGKIGVPARILDKPGRLTDEEFRVIREHTTIGARILEPIKAYADVVAIVRQHHERLSGEGYPDGLSGEQITLEARILAVADVYDALISERPYRPGMKKGEAIQLIKQETGSRFDQDVVAAFLAIVGWDGSDGEESASNSDLVDMEVLEIIGHRSKQVST